MNIFVANYGNPMTTTQANTLNSLVALATTPAGYHIAKNGSGLFENTPDTGSGGDVMGPSSATDNAIVRFDLATGKLIQNSLITIDDTGNIASPLSIQMGNGAAVTNAAGKLWYNQLTGSLNFGMGGGLTTQQVGEEMYVYGKATATIQDTPLQIVYKTGIVGASGVISFAPTVSGLTNPDLILGVATEPIATNGFGRIAKFGIVHNISTDGSDYGETWVDGETIWYNPVTGNPTKNKPTAPNMKLEIGTVINAGSGGSGSFFVNLGSSSTLGGTDSNVQFGTLANGQLIQYDSVAGYWKNVAIGSASGVQAYNANTTILGNTTTGTGSIVLATAPQISQIELGHATDTTLSRSSAGVLAVEGVVVPTVSSTNTLTNKRITKRVLALSAGSATPAINTDNYDVVHITAQSAAITSFTMTGTPVDGDTLRISITDNGTARAIAWGTSFEASTVALPTTTVASTRLDVGFFWNTETNKWRCVATA